MNNIEIRTALLETGMKKWELAERLGIPDSSLSRKLRKEIQGDEKQKILKIIHDRQGSSAHMRIVAAKVEKIIAFPDEQSADRYCEIKKKIDQNFDLLDFDNTGDEDCAEEYTIRVVESFEDAPMLVSSMTIDNDPNL